MLVSKIVTVTANTAKGTSNWWLKAFVNTCECNACRVHFKTILIKNNVRKKIPFLPLIAIFIVFYFFMLAPPKKNAKKQGKKI